MATNMTFTDYVTPVPADWLNNVNTFVNTPINTGIVSAITFGAVGNGSTDSTAALVAAEATGKQIYLPDGVYLSTSKRKASQYVGPGIIKVNGVVQPIAKWGSVVTSGNILPNCQWQLWGDVVGGSSPITKQLQNGTGSQTAVSYTSFTPTNAAPVFLTTNTQQIKVGDLVTLPASFWGFSGVGYINVPTAVRVSAVVPNTSITVVSPFTSTVSVQGGSVSPASSSAGVMTPVCAGALGTGVLGPDGWNKTSSLNIWADDFASNQCPGSIRTLGIRKGSASTESMSWQCPTSQLSQYLGRIITFGVLIRQSVQGGSGTWAATITDSVNGTTTSIPGTGTSYTDSLYGGFEFISIQAPVSATSTNLTLSLNFNGAVGDVYYVSVPTAVLGYNLGRENLGQNKNEIIRSKGHWNPPLLTPLQITFPTSAFPSSGSLYGYSQCDLQALSMDTVDKSVAMVSCKLELTTPTVGASLFIANNLPTGLIFGPQTTTQVANVLNSTSMTWLPLYDGGTFSMFTGNSGLVVTTGTFDFDSVMSS